MAPYSDGGHCYRWQIQYFWLTISLVKYFSNELLSIVNTLITHKGKKLIKFHENNSYLDIFKLKLKVSV